jgi:Tol biopolymer transport system component
VSGNGRTLLYGTERVATTLYTVLFDPVREEFDGPPRVVLQGAQLLDYIDVSPDGQWIAFGSQGRQEDILLIGSDGSGLRHLTDDEYRDRGPRWSPDGSRLAFYSNRGGPYAIWSIRPDGSRLEAIAGSGDGQALTRPTWAPDGRRLIGILPLSGPPVQIDLGQPVQQRVTSVPGLPGRPVVPQAWSPDGRLVAGTYEDGPDSNKILLYSSLKRVRLSHESPTQVWEGSLAWLADSQRLLFTARGAGITLLDTVTGRTRVVMPGPRGLTEFSVLAKAFNAPLVAFVERRIEGDLWLMYR